MATSSCEIDIAAAQSSAPHGIQPQTAMLNAARRPVPAIRAATIAGPRPFPTSSSVACGESFLAQFAKPTPQPV
jgi:hypothetical protein